MKRLTTLLVLATIIFTSCTTQQNKTNDNMNPFLTAYNTPFNVPPFGEIENLHFLPAIQAGINQQQQEIDAIISNPDAATFENTIEALDYSGNLLREVTNVFENLQSANTSDELQKLAKEASPIRSKHFDDIMLNEDLFARIKFVYDQKDALYLTTEQATLLEKTYKRFSRNGAELTGEKKDRMRQINEELSLLSLQFDENLLSETNAFELVIEDKNDLLGLPQSIIDAAAAAANDAGYEGKWMFTVQKPSMIPFLQYADNRNLREILFSAYINRGNNNNNYDNKKIAARLAALRVERANLLGYATHANYVLELNMAKEPENVYNFLDEVMAPALINAKKEAAALQELIDADGGNFKLEPWDWWYYTEKLKLQLFDLDEEALRPYFELNNVLNGLFDVANNLYGLKFEKLENLPVYHPDAIAYEVLEADGSHIGILYMDFHPRASKGGGAWMTSYRKQSKQDGENIPPVISMVMNFSKPTGDVPALLSFDEVSTLFHEFGHALHGLLSQCTYVSLSGTSVPRDFVELPSQVMENWAADPQVMKSYAKHYKTGDAIPQDLIDKLEASSKFNQGFTVVEYTSACYLDMDWHTLTSTEEQNTLEFENQSMQNINLIPEIVVRYRSPYFAHIFAGGYSSGYYSYLWAEVLDADAFQAFKETSIFNQETAKAFRENILEKGGTEDPMELYKKFRGREPQKDAMLERKGLI
jgi:peptidyl-dipeptidase Dcp